MSYAPDWQDQLAIDALADAAGGAVEVAFRCWLAKLPRHVPKTYDHTDGDVGLGHEVTDFHTFVRMGGDTISFVGDTVIFNGKDSYIRGGTNPGGYAWKLYTYTGDDDDAYESKRGSDVTGEADTSEEGVLYWSPTVPGLYSVELHMDRAYIGNEEPLGYGVRFVRVYSDPNDPALASLNVSEITLQGATDGTGWTMSATYTLPDTITATRAQFAHNDRVVVFYKYWIKALDQNPSSPTYGQRAWTDYTWNPGRGSVASRFYQPNILFRGLVQSVSVQESATGHSVTITAATAQAVLGQLRTPTTVKLIEEIAKYPVAIPTVFLRTDIYNEFIAKDRDAVTKLWVHRIADPMYMSDMGYHILHRHTNFPRFFDSAVWYTETDSVPAMGTGGDSIMAMLASFTEKRFSVMWSDRKSNFYVGPHLNLRGDEHWSTIGFNHDFVMEKRHIMAISADRSPATVGQVYAVTVDVKSILDEAINIRGKLEIATITSKMYKQTWPEVNKGGRRVTVKAYCAFDKQSVRNFAARYLAHLNAEYKSIATSHLFLPGLDLNQLILIRYDAMSDEATMEWSGGFVAGKPAYITSVTHQISPGNHSFRTTYGYHELTAAAAAEVPPLGPTAAMHSVPSIEVVSGGDEIKMLALYDWTSEGDVEIASRSWTVTPDVGAVQTSDLKTVAFFFGDETDTVTIHLEVTDAAGYTSTETRVLAFATLPVNNPFNASEAIWAAGDSGMYVSPDGGRNWHEPPNVGQATACWAQPDGQIGYAGTADGKVWVTTNMGMSWKAGNIGVGSKVMPHAMWGQNRPPSCILGTQKGLLYEAAYSPNDGELHVGFLKRFTEHTGNNKPITYVQIVGKTILVGAGEYLYAGSREYWTKLHHFPNDITSGDARGAATEAETNYSFLISLVFDNGTWEVGRVNVSESGITWHRFNVSPAVAGAALGADVAVGRLDPTERTAVLATFENYARSFLLDNATAEMFGPGVADPTVPDGGTGHAVKFGLDGRTVAFLGTDGAIYKNLDPATRTIDPETRF